MAKVVSIKSTKAEILEVLKEKEEELDALKAMKDDPTEVRISAEKERVSKSAADIIESGVLNENIVAGYRDLQTDIEAKRAELKELYGIEAKANTMAALVNAHKDKVAELNARYDDMKAALDVSYDEKKAVLQAEVDSIKKEKEALLEAKRVESADLVKALRTERVREEEEYAYNLKRTRKQENDAWADEKSVREKALTDREVAILARETEVASREAEIQELESRVANIPTLIEMAKEEAYKKGKADAEKSHAFEKRHIETKNEYEQKALNDQVVRLQADLQSAKEANEILQDKLDDAYKQMKELASETVKSSGGVKILDRDNSGK